MARRRELFLGLMAAGVWAPIAHSQSGDQLPPVPSWRPEFSPDIDEVADLFRVYTNAQYDFVVFENTTCCIVPDGLTKDDAALFGSDVLSRIIGFHPDMDPQQMRDGNVVVSYNHPAFSVVPEHFFRENWKTIELDHQSGLTPDEVLVTPLGPNVFDEIGKVALLARSYMFMDALKPILARHVRRA